MLKCNCMCMLEVNSLSPILGEKKLNKKILTSWPAQQHSHHASQRQHLPSSWKRNYVKSASPPAEQHQFYPARFQKEKKKNCIKLIQQQQSNFRPFLLEWVNYFSINKKQTHEPDPSVPFSRAQSFPPKSTHSPPGFSIWTAGLSDC